MLWLGFTLMDVSSCGCLLIVPIISAQNSKSGMTCQQRPLHIILAIGLVKQSIAQGQFRNSYHHFSTLAIFTLLFLYLNSPYFLFTHSLLSQKPIQQHLQSTSSFILVLGKANIKRAQSCIGGRQNLREYLFCLQLLVGFYTLNYLKRLQLIPYTCGLSRPFFAAVAGELQCGVNILMCACFPYH